MGVDIGTSRDARQGKRIFLHVGSPKTGSTFLQAVLWSQRALAREQGLLLPLDSFFDHFLATVDVREMAGEDRFPERTKGIWDKVVRTGQQWHGNVLVSHELFAGATAEQAERAVLAWGDFDVHIIVTARDLGRQIPAEWQEHLKHRSSLTFTEFVDALRTGDPASTWFWRVQDFADVCRRWGAAVPAANVHLVTVPGRGASPNLLWNRFATLVGLDAESFDLSSSGANSSLRAEQAELLRRINAHLGERLTLPGAYSSTVKEVLAQQVLQGRPGQAIALAGDDRAFAASRSADLVSELEGLGIDVVGDLAELIPADDAPGPAGVETEHPEAIADSVLLAEGIEAFGGLLEQLDEERKRASDALQERHRAQVEVDRARHEAEQLRLRYERFEHDLHHRPLRHLVIGLSEQHPGLMRLRTRYWSCANAVRRLLRRSPSG